MPYVELAPGAAQPVYQVGRKSFVFFRTPRPDAFDPETGERYDDVIVFWVDPVDKDAMVLDESTPYFTTPHFNGHPSVLLRGSRIGELTRDEVAEVVQDAWLSRASKRRPPSGSPSIRRADKDGAETGRRRTSEHHTDKLRRLVAWTRCPASMETAARRTIRATSSPTGCRGHRAR